MFRPVAACLCIVAALGLVWRGEARGGEIPTEPAPTRQTAPSPAISPAQTRALKVVVSIPPLMGLVEPLLPANSTIDVLIPPGVSEHGYEIPPAKLAAIARADLVVTVGLGLEPGVDKFLKDRPSAARTHVVFAEAVGLSGSGDADAAEHEHDHGHDHGHSHDHADTTNDPHLWLDPILTRQFTGAVISAVGKSRDANAAPGSGPDPLPGKSAELIARLEELDSRYMDATKHATNRTIVVGHDAYKHLAARYGLKTVALAGLHASEPTPKAIEEAIKTIKTQKAKVIFAEPQLNRTAAERIAKATGAEIRTLDPLGDGDYFRMMNENLEALKAALGDDRAEPAKTKP